MKKADWKKCFVKITFNANPNRNTEYRTACVQVLRPYGGGSSSSETIVSFRAQATQCRQAGDHYARYASESDGRRAKEIREAKASMDRSLQTLPQEWFEAFDYGTAFGPFYALRVDDFSFGRFEGVAALDALTSLRDMRDEKRRENRSECVVWDLLAWLRMAGVTDFRFAPYDGRASYRYDDVYDIFALPEDERSPTRKWMASSEVAEYRAAWAAEAVENARWREAREAARKAVETSEMNRESMTLREWMSAAGFETIGSAERELHKLLEAWRQGEDPTEHRAAMA